MAGPLFKSELSNGDAGELTLSAVSSYVPPSKFEYSKILVSELLKMFKSKETGLAFKLFPGAVRRRDKAGTSRPEEYSNIRRYLSFT
mmetsp:Transcript_6967/g.21999  ORF Transcript_6967/g.21999 Transcript_6967/m.21999 type:complete len:87 (-) Transcript_6967:1511-1771(-)